MMTWREYSLPLRELPLAELGPKIEEFRLSILKQMRLEVTDHEYVTNLDAIINPITEGSIKGVVITFELKINDEPPFVTGQIQRWLDLAPIANDLWSVFSKKTGARTGLAGLVADKQID